MLGRIEVLRGSGSVLYGSKALSGVTNLMTLKGGTAPLQATV
jgi:hemoglobin/transferrin/lactoferrin receptor protein